MDTKANQGFGDEASRKYGTVDFHTTQMLSSHGCFGQYLQRCGRWWIDGRALEVEVEESLDPDNIIGITLKKRSNWEAVKKFNGHVQPRRECDERTRQNLNQWLSYLS